MNLICLHPQPVSERTLHPARERAHDNLNKTALISHTAQVLKNSLNTAPAKQIWEMPLVKSFWTKSKFGKTAICQEKKKSLILKETKLIQPLSPYNQIKSPKIVSHHRVFALSQWVLLLITITHISLALQWWTWMQKLLFITELSSLHAPFTSNCILHQYSL